MHNTMSEVAALFRQAVDHQLHGRPEKALTAYDAIIRLNPAMAAAHCNRGIVLQALGKGDEALRSYDRAIGSEPRYADAYYNRGVTLALLGRYEEALHSYEQAIRFKPDHIAAHANRANALRDLKRFEEAVAGFDNVIALNPRIAMAHNHRGKTLQDLGRPEDALPSFAEAVRLQPDLAEAHYNRGVALLALKKAPDAAQSFDRAIRLQPAVAEAHHQRGKALSELGRPQDALCSFDRALQLKSDFAEAHNDRGNALYDLKRFDDALKSYECAIALKPAFAEAHSNKGNALHAMKRPDEALASHDRAVALGPDYAPAHLNRAHTLRELGRVSEALANYDRAIELDPDFADAWLGKSHVLADRHGPDEAIDVYSRALERDPGLVMAAVGKGMCLLQTGDFAQGWPLYEWRKKKRDARHRDYRQPAWSGSESLQGRTLLVHAEQGLGDTIQFCRYAPLARDRGAHVILAVQNPLVRLVRSLGPEIDVVGESEAPGGFDCHAALLSMPLLFRTDLANCPARVPYLSAEPERVMTWRERLGAYGFRVGICWQGNKNAEIDASRSFSLRHFQKLARLPGVRLISLQKHDGVEQLRDLPAGMAIETPGEDFDAPPDAFVDTAAIIETLDLVIASDTAVAHLAGALGRPTWVALKFLPDWRWLLGRSDSPWYPTMRLFRQPARDDWQSVFSAMEAELRRPATTQASPCAGTKLTFSAQGRPSAK